VHSRVVGRVVVTEQQVDQSIVVLTHCQHW
jgi:hypothetical protein